MSRRNASFSFRIRAGADFEHEVIARTQFFGNWLRGRMKVTLDDERHHQIETWGGISAISDWHKPLATWSQNPHAHRKILSALLTVSNNGDTAIRRMGKGEKCTNIIFGFENQC